jgi:D-arginine dehydrogenase
VDVIVVGAGIAGVSVAAILARSCKVILLERESHPAYHATGRSAALFSTIYGPEPVRALSRASQAFFEHPPDGFTETPLVRRRGVLHIATAAQAGRLEVFVSMPDLQGRVRRLVSAAARVLCPLLRPGHVAAAAFEPDAADIDVHGLLQGYLRQLSAAGGKVIADAEVVGLSRDAGLWTVRTSQDVLSAPIVINAAGAWVERMGALAGTAPIGLVPSRRTALLVDLPDGVVADAWPAVIDIEEQFYFKPEAGRLLLSPADETPMAPHDVQPDELDLAIAIDRVEAATTLVVRRIEHRWAGLRSFVPDRSPVVGYDPQIEGFFWLAAQGGYGLQTAPALARTAAALVLGQPLDADLIEAGADAAALAPERLMRATV